jgi:uncharacterized protein with ATP-grasp and redox domains
MTGVLSDAGKNAGETAVDTIDKVTLPEVDYELKMVVSQLQTLLSGFIDDLTTKLLPEVGKVVTSAVDQSTADIHSVLDRLNGTKIVVSSFSVTLQIPPQTKKG